MANFARIYTSCEFKIAVFVSLLCLLLLITFLSRICDGVLHNYPTLKLTSLDDRILELLQMLSLLDPLKRHQDVKLPRSKNAGKWLLELESFQKWQDASNTIEENGSVFCGYGILVREKL